MESKSKSRKLSPYNFFQVLQLEWLVADLRSRIYPKDKDKEHWVKVKNGKQSVIESIAEKNMLPTIFTDKDMRAAFEKQIYKPEGCPNFLYKDDIQKAAQEPLDLLYYYAKNIDVRFELNDEIVVGKVKSYHAYSPTVAILVGGEVISIPTEKVTRIL